MIRLLSIGGTGDAYLVCALAPSVEKVHGQPVMVALRGRYATIPEAFDQRYEAVDGEIAAAEANVALQREYDNFIAPGRTFYAHPCFTRNQRLDDLTILPRSPSQADMYRALLDLDVDAPMALPRLPDASPVPSDAILITDAVSWPNTRPRFWHALEHAMRSSRWGVRVNSPSWSLAELLAACASAELVVGPQCGVMSILCAARFPCRKVFATPSIDETGPWFNVGRRRLRTTYPYAYARKFDGNDYDVDEYRITETNHAEIIASILASPRGCPDPRPVAAVEVSLSPGDYLDRLAVLIVKKDRGLSVDREHDRYNLACPSAWREFLPDLVDLHRTTFDLLESTVPEALESTWRDDHAAVNLNRTRVEIKHRIDDVLHALYCEVKSYHG